MFKIGRRTGAVTTAVVAALALASCSSEGGRQETSTAENNAGQADTAEITVAMITHQAPGDTFWDIVRQGGEVAAQKDNIKFEYSNDPDAGKQSQLIQAAIDKNVDGIAVTSPNTGALGDTIKKAVAAGIPVTMFNAGADDALDLGALGYFGQGEKEAGLKAGEKIVEEGGSTILCVIHSQGQQQLEDRCDGVAEGAQGATIERLYVTGTDIAAVTTAIQAKLTQATDVDWVVTLGAPIALAAVKSVSGAGSSAKVGTFDTNRELVAAIQDGDVAFAIDQQPYLQGYLAVDAIWLYINNGNTIGGGENVATGPAFIDSTNIDQVAEFAAKGTR